MKKYLITQTQLDTLASLPMPRALAEELDSLKPIEPLTDVQIDEVLYAARCPELPASTAFAGGQGYYDYSIARAIEHHILGETP